MYVSITIVHLFVVLRYSMFKFKNNRVSNPSFNLKFSGISHF